MISVQKDDFKECVEDDSSVSQGKQEKERTDDGIVTDRLQQY